VLQFSSVHLLPELLVVAQFKALELVHQLEMVLVWVILVLRYLSVHLKKPFKVPLL
jgi:hypothetical protein